MTELSQEQAHFNYYVLRMDEALKTPPVPIELTQALGEAAALLFCGLDHAD